MKRHFLPMAIFTFALVSISPFDVSACVTKSGKDCDTTAAHKVYYSKKLVKLAPAGGVGATSHAQGFDQLGVPSFAAPPPAQQNFGSNPDGWFYLMPSSQHTGGFVPKPMPHRILQILSSNSERGGHQGGLIRADGSLTPYAVTLAGRERVLLCQLWSHHRHLSHRMWHNRHWYSRRYWRHSRYSLRLHKSLHPVPMLYAHPIYCRVMQPRAGITPTPINTWMSTTRPKQACTVTRMHTKLAIHRFISSSSASKNHNKAGGLAS